MSVVAASGTVTNGTVDVAMVHGADLTQAEHAQMRGIVRALKSLGLDVAEPTAERGGVEAGLRIVCTTLAGLDTATSAAGGAPIVCPMLRVATEVRGWVAAQQRVRAFWTTTPALAEQLCAAGARADCIGLSCHLDRVCHASRRARGLCEEDVVFAAVVDERVPREMSGMLQRAWERRMADPAARFAKASLLVSVADDAQLAVWRRWAEQPGAGARVVERRSGTSSPTTMPDLADCEILFGPATAGGLAPSWTAAAMLLRGKPVVAVGDVGDEPFGAPSPPHLLRVAAGDVDGLVRALQSVVDGGRAFEAKCAAGARQMVSCVSARALAVRVVAALRVLGAWDELVQRERS